MAERRGYRLPLGALACAMDALVTVHGFASMEVFGLLRPVAPAATSWREEVLAAELGRLGLTPA